MTIDEAIKHCEEVAQEKRYEYQECVAVHDMEEAMNCGKCAEEHRQLAEWLTELKQLREQTRWIPTSERYPKIEDEYKDFLVTDDKGEVSVQEFFISLDEEPQSYFSGMRQVIAWKPLPEPYEPKESEKKK